LSMVSLIIAMAYLLLVLIGAVGALLLLVWLFGDTPGEARTWRETTKSTWNGKSREESTSSAPVEIEPPEDRAA
jgi:hypothetical protein